jgi:hypothetical protein
MPSLKKYKESVMSSLISPLTYNAFKPSTAIIESE